MTWIDVFRMDKFFFKLRELYVTNLKNSILKDIRTALQSWHMIVIRVIATVARRHSSEASFSGTFIQPGSAKINDSDFQTRVERERRRYDGTCRRSSKERICTFELSYKLYYNSLLCLIPKNDFWISFFCALKETNYNEKNVSCPFATSKTA